MKFQFILFLLFGIVATAFSQPDAIEKQGRKYLVNNVQYNYKEIRPFLEQKPECLEIYFDGRKSLRRSRNYAIIAGVFTMGTGVLWITASSTNDLGGVIIQVLGGLLTTTGAVSYGIASLSRYHVGKKKINSAVDIYNFMESQSKDQSYFDIGISQNGVGIFYSF